MEELAGRFAALDPEAAEALKVIGYFDTLVDGHVGLETLVRGAAVLSGAPVRLVDPDRRLSLRVGPDGVARVPDAGPDPTWPSLPVVAGEQARAWLEKPQHAALDDLVLERLTSSVRVVLDRTRGRVVRDDAAALEILVGAAQSADDRARAARRLGWAADATIQVVAVVPTHPGPRLPELAGVHVLLEAPDATEGRPPGRVGVGCAGPVLDATTSWRQALTALRFTASGTPDDPGPTTMAYAALGGLALLADVVGPTTPRSPDVRDLERLQATYPWALSTLDDVARAASLRAASLAAHLHHSTLQARLHQLEEALGWSVSDPQGRLRLQLALAVRLLHAHP